MSTIKPNPKPIVVCTQCFHPEVIRHELKPHARVIIPKTKAQLHKALRQADGLITLLSDRVDLSTLALAPHLRVVGNYAVGYNNIDLETCRRNQIRVVNTPKVLTSATAELSLALLFAVARRVPEGHQLVRSGRFRGWGPELLLGKGVHGKKAVILGAGRIGKETARLFKAVGMSVEFVTRKTSESSLEKLLSQAQVLSLHAPLNESTRGWLNRKRIALLPRDCIVINTARGEMIDEPALIQALKRRKIFGAGLDVYAEEPQVPAELRKLPNVVLMPHVGSATEETRAEMARVVISGVLDVLNGKRPWNEVKV